MKRLNRDDHGECGVGKAGAVGVHDALPLEVRRILDSSSELILFLDATGNCGYVNSCGAHLLKCSPDKLIGKNLWQSLPQLLETSLPDFFAHAMNLQKPSRFLEYVEWLGLWLDIFVAPSAQGLMIWAAAGIPHSAQRGPDGGRAHLYETQAELQQYRDIFKNAQIGLCLDVEGGSVLGLMNDAFADIHGYTVQELVGRPVAELFPEYLREKLPEIARFVDSRDHASFETEHIRKDGTVFPVLVDATVIRDNRGAFLYRIINVKDVSDLKRAESELRVLNEALERKVRERTEALERSQESLRRSERLASLGTLAAGIAHEINNPLNSILMAANYALRKGEKDEVTTAALEQVRKEVKRCSDVTKSVLNFAREKASEKIPSDLNEVIAAGAVMAQTYGEKLEQLELHLCSPAPIVLLNRTDVERVIINLLQNAAQAARDGCTVRIATNIEDNAAKVTLEDNGPGISPEVLPRIFDPFFTTKSEMGGTGVGLSMVHSIMNDHNGSVIVSSAEGRGTTFVLTFPVVDSGS